MSDVGHPLEECISNPSLSLEDRGREVAIRFPLLNTTAGAGRIAKVLAWGYVSRAQRALSHLDEIHEGTDIQRLKEGLRRITAQLSSIAAGSNEEGPIVEALLDQAGEIERDRGRWKAIVQAACDGREERESDRIARAFDRLAEGMTLLGTDRSDQWNEARHALEELVANNAQSPTCLGLGFLRERMVENLFEAEQAYMNGVLEGVRRRDLAFILCARQMAFVQFRSGRTDAAFGTIEKALHARVDADVLVDVARYATAAKQPSRAKEAWQKALSLNPLAIIDLLGEDGPPGSAALELALATQAEARRGAQTLGEQCRDAIAKVEESEKRLGELLEIPASVRSGAKATSDFSTANLYEVLVGQHEAGVARSDLLNSARRALLEISATQRAKYEAARGTLEATQAQRDQATEQVKATLAHSETQARESMEQQLRDSNLQRGCGLSAGAGCGMMVIYIVATLVTSGMGIKIGPETSLGKVLIGLVIIPFGLGAIMQVAAGMKKAALEAEMVAAVKEAQSRFQQGNTAIGERFSNRLNELRQALQDAEADRRRAEEALQILS